MFLNCCCKLKDDDLHEPTHNLYCFQCGTYFSSVKELEEHKKKVHKTKDKIFLR